MNHFGELRKETVSQGGGGGVRPLRAQVVNEQTIKEYIPASWFHPVGIFKVLARFWDQLPDVSGKLFLTFTVDPKLYANEETAFEDSRGWLRKVFYRLRQGVEHEGKVYVIDAPYCIKVEFHESGWVHYHAIFLTSRFLPKELLAELWGLGWVKVQRVTTRDFRYMLKYVTKPEDLPDWVKKRKRLRVFQTTKGFLKEEPVEETSVRFQVSADDPAQDRDRVERQEIEVVLDKVKRKVHRASYTIDERFWRWACMAVIRQNGLARTVMFRCSYREIFDQLVLSAALAGRYKGSGEIIINRKEGLTLWLKIQSQLLKTKS
jgi:hypothetical protein